MSGKFTRFYGALMLGFAGFVLSFAWTMGPQQMIDAHKFAKLTARADGRIVDRWLALEWKERDATRAPDWRNVAQAVPCAVVEFDGDWGSTQRAYCGTRLRFHLSYRPNSLDLVAPGVPFDWARDRVGTMVPELRVSPAFRRYLEATPAVVQAFPNITHARNGLELLQFEMVAPVDNTVRGWSSEPARIPLAVDPADPSTAMPTAFVERNAKRGPDWVALAIGGTLGLSFYWAAMSLILVHIPLAARVVMAAVPLLALPWWGEQLPRAIEKLNADFAEVIEDMLGSVDRLGRLEATAPEDAQFAQAERLSWPATGDPYQATFGKLRLSRPDRVVPPDLALKMLAATAAAQVRTWPEEERTALFRQLESDKKRALYGAGTAFLQAAREALVDPRTPDSTRLAARAFLSEWVTQPVLEPHTGQIAFVERVQQLRELQSVGVPVIANPAGWIVERAEKAAAESKAR